MNNFICSECGTKYSSPELTPPPGIKWSDGHVCTPKPIINESFTEFTDRGYTSSMPLSGNK